MWVRAVACFVLWSHMSSCRDALSWHRLQLQQAKILHVVSSEVKNRAYVMILFQRQFLLLSNTGASAFLKNKRSPSTESMQSRCFSFFLNELNEFRRLCPDLSFKLHTVRVDSFPSRWKQVSRQSCLSPGRKRKSRWSPFPWYVSNIRRIFHTVQIWGLGPNAGEVVQGFAVGLRFKGFRTLFDFHPYVLADLEWRKQT